MPASRRAAKRAEIADWLKSARRRRGRALRARFDRLGVQHPRRRTSATRRSRSPMRSSMPMARAELFVAPDKIDRCGRASISAMPSASTTARAFAAALEELRRQARRRRSRARRRRDLRRARRRPAPRSRSCATRRAAQGDQEPGRDRRAQGGAGARRRGADALPALVRGRRRRRAAMTEMTAADQAAALPRGDRRAQGSVVRHDLRHRPQRRDRPLQGDRGDRACRSSAAQLYLVDSGGQYADGTTDVTRTMPIGTPTAEMQDRFTRVLKGHIALATRDLPRRARAARQLDGWRGSPCGQSGSITRMAPATASAAICRCMKGRSASRSPSSRRRRRAAARRHDPLQRAGLLQDRRIRHPHRESRAGRASRRSRAPRSRCSASRR